MLVLHHYRVGGSIPVIFSYYTEFLPKYRRGAMISALATFWMGGNIIAAGKTIPPLKKSFLEGGVRIAKIHSALEIQRAK